MADTPAEGDIIEFSGGVVEQFVDVRPGSDNSVSFPVTIDGRSFLEKDISTIICTLEADIGQRFYSGKTTNAPGWNYQIDPQTVELSPGEQKVVTVSVSVPERTSYYSLGELTITGSVTTLPGNEVYSLNEIDGIIRISYYDDWKLTSSKLTRTIKKGETSIFEVNLHNMGNGNDIFFQSIKNENKLIKNDIKFEYPVNIELDERSTTKFDFIVTTSDKTPKGEYVIEFCSKPTDINDDEDKSGNYLYCIQFVLTVEPGTVEQYMIPSAVIFIIVLIVVFVKIVKHNKKDAETETEIRD
jgi:hypothetical protein